MPKKDKMLVVRTNVTSNEQEFVFNACSRSAETDEGYFVVPLSQCFGTDATPQCKHLCIWKSPDKNSKDRKVIYCMNFCRQPEESYTKEEFEAAPDDETSVPSS